MSGDFQKDENAWVQVCRGGDFVMGEYTIINFVLCFVSIQYSFLS